MLELLYTALFYLIQPLIWIRLWVRGRKAPAYRKRWGERYGFYRRPLKPGGIMLHSVSVGETLAAIPLVSRSATSLSRSTDHGNDHDANRFRARTVCFRY
ncbi:glycosyltransferase N-terminal domain-containing protein [Citrobacter murliniae]